MTAQSHQPMVGISGSDALHFIFIILCIANLL